MNYEPEMLVPAEETKPEDELQPLATWVIGKTTEWRDWRRTNYATKFDTYERLWRGVWDGSERLRDSERSKIVTPALSEAVENAAAEIEEATFGRGDYFDLQPLATDDPRARQAVEQTRAALKEDLARVDFASNVSECILNAAVYGTGIGEIVLSPVTIKVPTRDPITGMATAEDVTLPLSTLRSVNPRNFLIDPNAKTIEEALGVAIEEYVGKHLVLQSQKSGVFRDGVDVCAASTGHDEDLQADKIGETQEHTADRVHLIRYYGLVPRKLLFPNEIPQQPVDVMGEQKTPDYEDGEYVEAIVVIGNESVVLKAEENPYLMRDRPVTAFRWDIVPGRFYGRGICEKGEASQRMLDAEVRARLDSLALTTVPMMALDANRVPRGFKFEVRPGKSILTNGNPQEVLHPFKFGQLDPNHWQNAASLQAMVQQATGSVDATAMAGQAGQSRTGAMSITMAPLIKRYRRTMVHFIDEFLMPALEKIAHRSMQFQPRRYPPVPLQFRAQNTMGIMAREVETQQLTALLATMQPGTPEHRAILMGIVSNTSIPNREQVLHQIAGAEQREQQAAQMQMAAQQNPQAQQLAAVTMQLEISQKQLDLAKTQAEIRKLEAEAVKINEEARTAATENELEALRIATKGIYALDPEDQQREFEKRYKMAKLALEEAALEEKRQDRVSNERITREQMGVSAQTNARIQTLQKALDEATQGVQFDYDESGRPVAARPMTPPQMGAM